MLMFALLPLVAYADSEPYAVLSNNGLTVTFYYDGQKDSRGGISIIWGDHGFAGNYLSATTAIFDSSFAAYRPTSTCALFSHCTSLTTIIGMNNLKTDQVENMNGMFVNCESLTNIDLSSFNTANVIDMGWMFGNCTSLTSLDVSSFKTDKVTDMNGIFVGCSSLTNLDVSGFKTDNVTDMRFMFANCSGLRSLDVSRFKTNNVTDMCMMFNNCSGLTNLDVSGIRTDKVESMNNMFSHCSGVRNLDVSGFNTANVIDMTNMFAYCSKLRSVDVSNFSTENVGYMSGMFRDCPELTILDLSSFNTSNVTTMKAMFWGCEDLGTIYASESLWNTSQVDKDEDVFGLNDSLSGGNGTIYNGNHTGVEYARIDKPGSPGYLTAKSTLTPMKNQEEVNYVEDGSADKYADLFGTIIDNIFYNISSANGGFDADDNCVVVNKAMADEDIEAIFGKDIFSNEVKTNYAGIIIKVPQGNGKVTIQAQATGGMMLMVKIGTADPVKKELAGKQIVDFLYDADRPAYVYIYAGMSDGSAEARTRGEQSSLRIYGLSVSKESTGIVAYGSMPESADVYSIDGRLIRKSKTSLQNLPKGIYIRNGKKYIVK